MNIQSYIICILTIYLSLWSYHWYYNKLTYQKNKMIIENSLIFLLTAILAIILESKCDFFVKQIVTSVMYFIPIISLKLSIKDKIFFVITNYFTWILIDQFVTMISTMLINSNIILSINLSESIYYYLVLNYLVLGLYIIVFNNKRYITLINKMKILILNNYKILIYAAIWSILLYFLISYDLFNTISVEIRIFILILSGFISLLMLELIIHYSKNINLKKYTDNLLLNIEGNKKNIETFKIEKHNINHFLVSLKEQDNLELNKRIDTYLEMNNKIKVTTNNIFDIPYNMSGFILKKINQYNCKFYINGAEFLKNIKLDNPRLYNEVCNAIGITIDNAYDAIKNKKSKEVLIDINKKNDKIEILISNVFENSIDINELGNLFYTTKDKGNGIGLFSIYKSKYIKYKVSIINNIFNIKLII